MKFSNIDMQGDFKSQIVIDVSALVWNSSDERRLIYDETTKQLWTADSSKWKAMGKYNNIPESTQMWVYADAAPDGWFGTNLGVSETLTAVKGGAYAVGGTVDGNWATPAHSHLLSHTHTASGSVPVAPDLWIHRDSETGDHASKRIHSHPSVSLASGAGTTGTDIDGASPDYRPRARVGLICIR